MNIYFNKSGERIDLFEWAELLENRTYAKVAQTRVNGKYISTVWLGLDHGYGNNKLIFETMVFNDVDMSDSLDQERYGTLNEAIRGHEEMVKKYEDEETTSSKIEPVGNSSTVAKVREGE